MASLVSQTTATTSFGDLSLSALENLRYIVSGLTTNHEVGQPLNLAEARRFLLDTYFQSSKSQSFIFPYTFQSLKICHYFFSRLRPCVLSLVKYQLQIPY